MRKKENYSTDKKNRSVFENFHMASMLLALYDIVMSAGAYLAALWTRFDCEYTQIPYDYLMAWLKFVPVYAAVCVFVFFGFSSCIRAFGNLQVFPSLRERRSRRLYLAYFIP